MVQGGGSQPPPCFVGRPFARKYRARARLRNLRDLSTGPSTGEHWAKPPTISMLDDVGWIWSKRPSGTDIVARLYRLVMKPIHVVQRWDPRKR